MGRLSLSRGQVLRAQHFHPPIEKTARIPALDKFHAEAGISDQVLVKNARGPESPAQRHSRIEFVRPEPPLFLRGRRSLTVPPASCSARTDSTRRELDQGVALGAGADSARFLSSAALAVACCRRSASDFKFGLGVVWVAVSGFSEREHAPSDRAHASKMTVRIVFIGNK